MKIPLTFASLGLLAAIMLPLSFSSQAHSASLLFGQKHAYSAVVRDDKRVVTYGKVFLSNPEDKDLEKASFSLPEGVRISNLSIYQVTLPERCKSELAKEKPDDAASARELYYPTSTCTQLEQQAFNFDHFSIYYAYDTSTGADSQLVYNAITPERSGDTFNLELPEAIEPGKRGAYLVAYMAEDGYVTGSSFGLYNLAFKTLRVPESIQEVRVSIDVSEDLYTRAKPSDINRVKSEGLSISDGASVAGDDGITSRSLDTIQSNIGSGGTFTKTGKALTPNEEFVVNGEFADAEWKLYFWWIVGGILGSLAVLGLTVFLLRKAASQDVNVQKNKGENHAK